MTGLYVASNPTSLTAQFNLTRNMGALTQTLTRLSTGLKINSGKDDPAGLIASELLKSDITGTTKAITNTQRANSMIATADSAMGQISNLLNDIKGLVVEGANEGAMSSDQIAANQMQINASVDAIDRIAKSTTYAGNKLLDGSMDFSTDQCGGSNSSVSNVSITSANFGTTDKISVDVNIQQAARRGTLIYNGTGVDQKTTFNVTGSTGTETFTFGAGTTNQTIVDKINASSDSTGVQARLEGVASRGTVTLDSAGANNGIVITSNETGAAAGNYSFKIVAGDQEGVRIASQATDASPGVVEIMLKQGYQRTHNGVGGILDVSVKADADAAAPAAASSGVTIKKGTVNQAVYHDGDTSAAATTKDGGKTVSVNFAAAAAGDAILATDMSKLNGWTFKVTADATVINGQTLATDGVIYDDESKVAYVSASNDGLASVSAAVTRISGTATTLNADGSGLSVTGTLIAGDEFTLGGGGAAGELELTYKEGATVNDLLKVANNATGQAVASLAQGVDGNALVKDILSGNSRSFATTMTASKFTSTATANDVIAMINQQLGDKFTAALKSGDSGTGLVGFMDAAADSGSVNMDNAIRFSGMDNGPIVRMVTTKADGTKIANQKLSVSLINPTEADKANGIHTPVLQINLATDGSGNSITTAADLVDLFNSLTPEQTGGISASLILPDGVDPNGRTWITDECGNVSEYTDCNAVYGKGIVQPTGVPGTCEINQNDLVLLGANQKLVDDYTVARIGSVSSSASDAINVISPGETADADGNSILTTSNHSGLAGVKINFTTDANTAGFDEGAGTLVVYASPETQALTATPDLAAALTDAVNGAIAQNWQGIRQFTGSTGDATTVTVTLNDAATYADAAADLEALLAFADNDTNPDANSTRGINATDPALVIKSIGKGTDMAGVKVVLQNDDTLAAGEVAVGYDKENGVLTIKANGAGGIVADTLANALNNNDVFKANFSATANTIVANNTAPTAGDEDSYGVVYFSDGNDSAATFTGGYKIETAEKATGNLTTNLAETSSGIGMTGANDSNERIVLEATEVGSEHFVKVDVKQGSFDTYCPLGLQMCELAGTDVVATINGIAATGKGNNISIDTPSLALSMDTDGKVGTSSFNITGGGALFQLGSNVVSSQQMRLGLGSMLSSNLGGTSGTLYQLKNGGDADIRSGEQARVLADKIVNEAISYVANTRGRLGAVQKSSLDPNISMLQDSLVALTEAEASYSNADFAEESSNLTRLQLLVQSGMSTLGIANQFPQYAASLVR